jgi:hypothetical protein
MASNELTHERREALVDRLRTLRVEGSGMGGPHVGIGHNELTREILAAGEAAIPLLIARLADSGFDETVYIVFLLRELHATEAEPAIRKLQSDVDRRSGGRDLTLKMQINYFLRDVGSDPGNN